MTISEESPNIIVKFDNQKFEFVNEEPRRHFKLKNNKIEKVNEQVLIFQDNKKWSRCDFLHLVIMVRNSQNFSPCFKVLISH